ncbi:6-phosphogluconate dehydrogenase [Actinomadura sp. NBRC 104412]|uniref:NAD(P)-dependent oxidoreductase n=1 Tax=Actinomadura sp. NBRC 104412 TaxID=3032203 RepID=UPI0024A34988|nr:NAD(P)-binding domain-containing protein [Actinomadura sp. NBRC 104412]GLZ07781.1 6-phosphogluconate dehydrogenase [Actinomadura sp. NBRC 104412]
MGEAEIRTVETIGLIGWGRMGGMMGTFAVRAGWPVVAYDASEEARAAAAQAGATVAGGVAEVAASSDLVLLVVVDDTQVKEAITGPDGILGKARPGTIVAICPSVRPDTCTEMARVAAGHGVHVIDVALVGGERGAEAGALKLMCGGPSHVVDACLKAFAAFAINVCHVGDVGAGQVAKTANNLLLWSCIRANYEALTLARKLGVDPGKLRAFLSIGSGANRPLEEWGAQRLRWPKKDLEVALALAEDAGVHLPMIEALQPLIGELTVEDLADLR